MSRRVEDRGAKNQQVLKSLLKMPGNNLCADCKRNKHPRWASWNLGVFVCIRCSGIHRGMGTHISRVKSVDLDAWTDEQTGSIVKWGNQRANLYWEAQLAANHVPSEGKIENFIRTKYESKRWALSPEVPDPATLDTGGDDDTPLNVVQDHFKQSAPQRQAPQPQRRAAPTIDLFGDDISAPPPRPSTTDNATRPQPRSADPTLSRPPKQPDSLLGLDFLGNSTAPVRPSSALSNPTAPTGPSRPDLKQSILSLYSSAPKTQQAPAHTREPSFGLASGPSKPADAFGGLTDAFGGLTFPTQPPQPAQPQTTPAFSPSISAKSVPVAPQVSTTSPLSGGSFFDSLPSSKSTQAKAPAQPPKSSNGLDFAFAQSIPASTTAPSSITKNPFADDDFAGFSDPAPAPAPAPRTKAVSPNNLSSAFNLSTQPISAPKAPIKSTPSAPRNDPMFDPWSGGESNAWAAPESAPVQHRAKAPSIDIGKPPARITANDISSGWGEPAPKKSAQPTVTADEDYGGWTSASTSATPTAAPNKPAGATGGGGGGFGGASDPFDNPWG